MGRRTVFCATCGKSTNHQTYCSDACKMRAYRKRKKQRDLEEAKTIDFDSWVLQDKLVKTFGESMDYHLGHFFASYGKPAYLDLLNILDRCVFQVVSHGHGD